MDKEQLVRLLEQVRDGQTSVNEAIAELKYLPYRDIGSAKIDHHRQLRSGIPEVVIALENLRPRRRLPSGSWPLTASGRWPPGCSLELPGLILEEFPGRPLLPGGSPALPERLRDQAALG